MSSEVFMSDGTLLQVSNTASPEAYATITGVTNVTPPSRVRKTAEVYVHDQSAPIVKTGAYEAQECTFTLAFDPGDSKHQALRTAQSSKSTGYYRIVLPTSPTFKMTFSAMVTSFEIGELSAEGTDPITANVTLMLSADFT